jgi:hypothetical protein
MAPNLPSPPPPPRHLLIPPRQCFTSLGEYTVDHGEFHPDRNFGRITLDATQGSVATGVVKARGVLCNYRGMCTC